MSAQFPPSLWAATATQADPSPQAQGDITCDTAIVGAGFTGLRAALHLAEAGSSVVVLDAGDVGWGASGRNGGQVNPMLPYNGPKELTSLIGPLYAERLAETSLGSADALFDLIRTYQIDCQPRQNGWLRVNHCASIAAITRENAQGWNGYGAGMEEVSGADLHAMTGTRTYESGILAPRGGAVHPLSLARGLARVARAAGAQIFGRSHVTTLTQTQAGWQLSTRNARINAQTVILATNGYTDGLLPALPRTILPLVSIQIASDPLPPDMIQSILPGGQTISDTRRVIMYARREPDNRMVFGGIGRKTLSGQITGHKALIRDAIRVFPQLSNVDWRFRWGGQIAVTDDHLPHLYEPAKGLLAGLGYNGRGVAMSHVMGKVLAERALGAAADSLAFPVSQMRPMPLRRTQMLGKGAAIWWWQLRDRIEMALG